MSSKRNNESDEDDFEKDFRSSSKSSTKKKAKKSESPQNIDSSKDSSSNSRSSRRKTINPEEAFNKELEKAIALSLSESTSSSIEKECDKIAKCPPVDQDTKKERSTESVKNKDISIKSEEQQKSSNHNPKVKEAKEDCLNDDEDDFIVKPKNKTSKTNLNDLMNEDKIVNDEEGNKTVKLKEKDKSEAKSNNNKKIEIKSKSEEKCLKKSVKNEEKDFSSDSFSSTELSESDDDEDDFKSKSKKKQSTKSAKMLNEKKSDKKITPKKPALSKKNENEGSNGSTLNPVVKLVDIADKQESTSIKNNAQIIHPKNPEVKPILKSSENISNPSPSLSDKKQLFTTASSVLNNKPSISTTSNASSSNSSSFFPKIDFKATPSNVRVGLSRNSKVKPLHPNVKPA